MTTIEFCEKSMKQGGYNTSVYDHGLLGNIQGVLGDNPLLWLLPCSPPSGTGLNFVRELEPNRGIRKKSGHKPSYGSAKHSKRSRKNGGTNSGSLASLPGETTLLIPSA